jgi:hypothetical protein
MKAEVIGSEFRFLVQNYPRLYFFVQRHELPSVAERGMPGFIPGQLR